MSKAAGRLWGIVLMAGAITLPAFAARDTTPPTITITTPTTVPTWTAPGSPLTVAGNAADNVSVKSVKWANAATGATGTASGTNTWSASIALAAGQNIITVTARDAAANAATDTITVSYNPPDTSAPTVIITSPTSANAYCTASSPLALGGTASDNQGVSSVTWANAASNTWGLVNGATAWSASIPLLTGGNLITIQAFDAAGNKGTDAITVAWNAADVTPPSIEIQSPTNGTTFTTTATPLALGGIASDNASLTGVSWTNAANGASGAATGTTSWSAVVPVVAGKNPITVTARDATGNVRSDSISVDFQDSRSIGHLPEATLPPLA